MLDALALRDASKMYLPPSLLSSVVMVPQLRYPSNEKYRTSLLRLLLAFGTVLGGNMPLGVQGNMRARTSLSPAASHSAHMVEHQQRVPAWPGAKIPGWQEW